MHRKQRSPDVDVEQLVEMLFGDGSEENKFGKAGVGENNIESPLHLGDGLVEPIKVGRVGNVSLNARHIGADSTARSTGLWRGARCAWPPYEVGEGCGQSTPRCAPHIQGLRSPPDKKITSAAVINTRSNRALSRLKSKTETKSSASTRIRITLVIVVINSSP